MTSKLAMDLISKAMSFLERAEARRADPSLISGMYWIDPDGQGVGDDPINVYCNTTSGSTSVLHDSESLIDVGHCADPGCYSRTINYSATNRQITALAELSNECHQTIKYDCVSAPLEINGVAYSWWNDKNGNPQYFWSGNNASVHTCQCGIDHNCVESFIPCNCDSSLPTLLTDHGVITEKHLLPITRLNFGRTILESSSGKHTLGRFECTGQVVINGIPTSCEALWRIGHTFSGIYSVLGAEQIESVYCDFTKLPNDSGFQTWIGYAEVKSSPIYFYVQTTKSYNKTLTPIPFDVERLNVGGAMNLSSGKFTAPVTGKYFFSFAGMAHISASSSSKHVHVALFLNGSAVGSILSDESNNEDEMETLSLQSTLHLQTGDQIWLHIQSASPGSYLYDDGAHYAHFTGWLLQENISASLNVI